MSLIEFIGMLVTFGGFLVLSIKKQREDYRRKNHPEEFQQEIEQERRAYKEMLKSLELPIPPELEDESATPAPGPKQEKETRPPSHKSPPAPQRTVRKFQFHSPLDSRRTGSRIDNRRLQNAIAERQQRFKRTVVSESMQSESSEVDPYAVEEEARHPRSQELLHQLKTPAQMVLYHEIFGKPKGAHPAGHLRGLPWDS